MDAEAGITLLEYALEQEEDQRLFERWVQDAQYSMSFESFKESLKKRPAKSEKAVLEDVENILCAFEKER